MTNIDNDKGKPNCFNIDTKMCTYIAFIETYIDSNRFDLILYSTHGQLQKHRIYIRFFDKENKDTANLECIKVEQNLNVLEILESKLELQNSVFTALHLVKKHFPNIKNVTLRDKWHKPHERWNIHGATISMNGFIIYLCYNGKTWYDQLLGAKIVDCENILWRDTSISIDEEYEKVKYVLLKDFCIETLSYFSRYNRDPRLIEIETKYNFIIEDVYNECKIIIPFINRLKEIITDKNDLYFILDLFIYRAVRDHIDCQPIKTINLLNCKWNILLDSVPSIEFEEILIDTDNIDYNESCLFTDFI